MTAKSSKFPGIKSPNPNGGTLENISPLRGFNPVYSKISILISSLRDYTIKNEMDYEEI